MPPTYGHRAASSQSQSTPRALPQIKRLKPSSLYVVKIKASDGGVTLRSDKMSTISLEEERTRNVDMANFAGGCHDCLFLPGPRCPAFGCRCGCH